jgi:hypothetical protein
VNCAYDEHNDSGGSTHGVQEPSAQHSSGCQPGGCEWAHTAYSLSAADQGPVQIRVAELRGLVDRLLRAARDENVAELASLARDESSVRVNFARGAVQVVVGHTVVAHASVPGSVIDAVLAHH